MTHPLPFLYDAELVEPGGDVVVELRVSVWPASGQQSGSAGEYFTHTGEAPLPLYPSLTHNRTLVIADGPAAGRYKIVGATPNWGLKHVGLELIGTKAGGG